MKADRWLTVCHASHWAGAILDVLIESPGVLRILYLMRRHKNLHALFARLEQPIRLYRFHGRRTNRQIVRGIAGCLWLLGVRRGWACVPRSLAIFAALKNNGQPVVFCSGFRRHRVGKEIRGHAWVELDGRVLAELHEDGNRTDFQVNFTHP